MTNVRFARQPVFAALILAGLCQSPSAVRADDTWRLSPSTNRYNLPANWAGNTIPTGGATAIFGSSTTTNLLIDGSISPGALQFNAGTPAYSFTIENPQPIVAMVNINGAGIVNNGSTPVSIVNSEILTFSNSSTAGSALITNLGTLRFADSATAANSTILLSGFSGMSFGGTSTAENATINVQGGTVLFANSSSAGNATVNVTSGLVEFFGSATGGRARFVVSGAFDISSGSASVTVGSIEGDGLFTLGANQLVVGTNDLSTIVSGTIVDGNQPFRVGGSLTKVGNGTLTLTGANTYTGLTAVNGGTLVVNGSLVGPVSVNSGGTLAGAGAVGSLAVNNGGIVAPGNAIGTLTVKGNFTQNGGTYVVDVNNAGQGDKINAGGKATINGGSVQVVAQSGNYTRKIAYTILTAAGGVSGAYSNVTSNFAFLRPTLGYDANNIYLLLGNNSFASGAQTTNQYSVGAALDRANASATGDFANVLDAISALDAAQGPAALNAISGQNYSGFSSSMVLGAQLFMSNFLARASGFNKGTGKLALAEACDVACDATEPAVWGAWGGALGGAGTIGGNANSGTLTYSVGGFAAGLDRKFTDSFLAGVTVGFTSGQQWVGGFDGRGVSSTVLAGLYGSYAHGAVYLDGLAGYAYSSNQMWRNITIPGLQPRTAQGLTGANQVYGQIEGGYRLDLDSTTGAFVTPFVRVQGFTGTQNAFGETGAQSLNLNVAAQTTSSLRSVLGAKLGGSMDVGWRDKLNAQFRLGWSHEFADTSRPVSATFAGAPTIPFTTYGASPQRDGVIIGLAVDTEIAQATSIYLHYEGDISSQDSNHALTAGLRMKW